ncbi:ACP S-malonyltransferase [Dolosicoccus paucivorans]|uniref:ACP S-malonyltransferase n=1 Tax=Dolosicoccus paucivorans TaxID=84521 RepID=UPI000881F5BC|nr:ACP S-malonyltransferase [Dolosicoccus paucivorans]SDI33749.1 [acyl-carrier-protein] S-malonyltransferase [Dolosicoccus paucivorans]
MKLAIVFNGQGAHYQKMGLDFFKHFSKAKDVLMTAQSLLDEPLLDWIENQPEKFEQTKYAQPAIAAVSLAIYESIRPLLPSISYMAGLSLGEYSALIASGYLTLEEGLELLIKRGELMSTHCDVLKKETPSQMLAVVGVPLKEVQELIQSSHLKDLWVANINSTGQIIVAGSKKTTKAVRSFAKEKGYRRLIPLKVEGPFHTPLMNPIRLPYEKVLDETSFKLGKVPVISNTTLQTHRLDEIKPTLVDHLTKPVRWQETIDWFSQQGVTHLIQIGPGSTLVNLLKREKVPFKYMVVEEVADVDKVSEFVKEIE